MTRKKKNKLPQKHPQNKAEAILKTHTDELSQLEQSIKEKREQVLQLSQTTNNHKLKYHLLKTIRECMALLIKFGLHNKDKCNKTINEELGYLNLLAGQVFMTLNKISLAKECLWDSIAYKPEQYLGYYHLTLIAMEDHHYEQAYQYINTAIKYVPSNTEHRKTLYLMGCIEYAIEEIDAAIVSFKLLLNDKMMIANYPLCLCYIVKKQHQDINEIAANLAEMAVDNELLNNFNQCLLMASRIFINDGKVDIHDFKQRLTIDFEKVDNEIPLNDVRRFIHYFNKALNLAEKRQSQFNLFKAVPTEKTGSVTNQHLLLGKDNVYRPC